MRKLTLILLTVRLIYSCNPRIENNTETMKIVFAMSDFDIEIQNSGCFGGSKEYFVVELINDGYLFKSKRTGKSHLVEKNEMDSLKSFKN